MTRPTSWSSRPVSSSTSGTRRCGEVRAGVRGPDPRQDRSHEGNPFARGGLWLARLDVLARNSDGILDKACEVDWDLIIFDEAHKMSATVWGSEVKKTKRYQMAEELGSTPATCC